MRTIIIITGNDIIITKSITIVEKLKDPSRDCWCSMIPWYR